MAASDTCAGDTPSRRRAVWLSPPLLLLLIQGCFCLSGPSTVRGTEGGSLSVQCRYEEEHRMRAKFWCRHPCLPAQKIVKTKLPEVEARSGRVSIRDHPANLTFTVTLENLSIQDAGTYQCGVDVPQGWDIFFLVTVLVSPGEPGLPVPSLRRAVGWRVRLGRCSGPPVCVSLSVRGEGAHWLLPSPTPFLTFHLTAPRPKSSWMTVGVAQGLCCPPVVMSPTSRGPVSGSLPAGN
uniref:Ig-like domain-containing protein n=1 Tax=Oryctolagus cuniculus TaxID=9986 RepID=A0A5F9CLP8_RABIT